MCVKLGFFTVAIRNNVIDGEVDIGRQKTNIVSDVATADAANMAGDDEEVAFLEASDILEEPNSKQWGVVDGTLLQQLRII